MISGCLQPTQLSWLPLKCSAMFHLLLYAVKRQLTIYASNHRSPSKLICVCWCLWASTSTACISMPNMVMHDISLSTQWREDWLSASVVNHTIVTLPTIQQPDFDIPRHTRSLTNRFRTGQGPCRFNLHNWGLAQSPRDCGQWQPMNHIVDTCPLTKFEGGLNLLHEADDDAVIWLESTATAALAK